MTVLPPEIWLHILHIAVQPSVDPRADEYRPFQPIPDQRLGAHVALVARLARVCRSWHSWLLPTLYSDVKISREPIPFPQYVKRVVLPYTSTSYDSHPDPSAVVDNLCQCAQLEILSRPPGRPVGNRFAGPPPVALPSLQRLEWCLIEDTDDPVEGGINSFIDVALECPELRYLLLLLDGPIFDDPSHDERIATMSKLETLRVTTVAKNIWSFATLFQNLVFPALKTFILDHAIIYRFIGPFMRDIGGTLTRLEPGDDTTFTTETWLQSILRDLPILQDLGYHFCVAIKVPSQATHQCLRRIRLHPGKPANRIRDDLVWKRLCSHRDAFNRPGMTSLTTFILHGREEWFPYMQDPQWKLIVDSITATGRSVVLDWEEKS